MIETSFTADSGLPRHSRDHLGLATISKITRRITGIALILSSLLALMTGMSVQAHGESTTAIPMRDTGYAYKQVSWGAEPGFEAVGYDDSSWAIGTAGFGSTSGPCSWNNPIDVQTNWEVNTDLLVRKHFTLPPGAHNLRVTGTIDNDATVYINGVQIGYTESGYCIANAIDFVAPDALLRAGDNVLAIRGHDHGGWTYLDVQVTYDDAPLYSICALYDQSKAHKAGATVAVKLQLCDGSGTNLSSEAIVVQATGLTKLDNSVSSVVEDAGNANSPDDNFRYDADLGGYIYNLSTKGLTTGTWVLNFTVNGEVESSYAVQFDVK